MNFKTSLEIKSFNTQIKHEHKLLFLGSCFAENMSKYFKRFGFQISTNPFGILYHPLAIQNIIDISLEPEYDFKSNIIYNSGLWSSFDAHSSLSDPEKSNLIEHLKASQSQTYTTIKNAKHIFISLGTAWVYRHLEKNISVSNCHKIPQSHFKKTLLELSEIENTLYQISSNIFKINPDANIILTLSPVRHLKDGFINNQLSKSILHIAIQKTTNQFDKVFYFPSYELLLDDLRDYRFYEKDMLHPNALALDYIWSKIEIAFFDKTTQRLIKKVETINKRLEHRFFNPKSFESKKFKNNTKKLISNLNSSNPEIAIQQCD